MLRTARSLMAAVAILFAVNFAAAEVLKDTDRFVAVQYRDGVIERYRVAWTGTLHIDKHESGGPAKPLEGKFIDDRQCHWSLVNRIDRVVFLVNRTGQQFEDRTKFTVVSAPFANEGTRSLVTPFGQNCGQVEARFQSDLSDMRRKMNEVWQNSIQTDFTVFKNALKQNAEVVRIEDK